MAISQQCSNDKISKVGNAIVCLPLVSFDFLVLVFALLRAKTHNGSFFWMVKDDDRA